MDDTKISIVNINELLDIKLTIPNYQRPYKWTSKNITDLLDDIYTACRKKKKYRLGTIILHNEESIKNIVDGQQRIISLYLIKMYIDKKYKQEFLNKKITNNISIINIYNNYKEIENWFKNKTGNINKTRELFKLAFNDILEVVLIEVEDISLAFQLFDSQNSRGKPLVPQDLLKAYHIKVITDQNKLEEQEYTKRIEEWNKTSDREGQDLFNNYLFPILNWSMGNDNHEFTVKDIDCFKGISKEKYEEYFYTKRITNKNNYQITEPFIEGLDYFNMLEYYKIEKDSIIRLIEKQYSKLNNIINLKRTKGEDYIANLFFATILAIDIKFGKEIPKTIIYKVFIWAYMLRIDLESINKKSINRYALGGEEEINNYTNKIPMFKIIRNAFSIDELYDINIITEPKKGKNISKYQEIYNIIREIDGGHYG